MNRLELGAFRQQATHLTAGTVSLHANRVAVENRRDEATVEIELESGPMPERCGALDDAAQRANAILEENRQEFGDAPAGP